MMKYFYSFIFIVTLVHCLHNDDIAILENLNTQFELGWTVIDCNLSEIECDGVNPDIHVVQLNLSNKNLSGSIPNIHLLSALQTLDLSNNCFDTCSSFTSSNIATCNLDNNPLNALNCNKIASCSQVGIHAECSSSDSSMSSVPIDNSLTLSEDYFLEESIVSSPLEPTEPVEPTRPTEPTDTKVLVDSVIAAIVIVVIFGVMVLSIFVFVIVSRFCCKGKPQIKQPKPKKRPPKTEMANPTFEQNEEPEQDEDESSKEDDSSEDDSSEDDETSEDDSSEQSSEQSSE